MFGGMIALLLIGMPMAYALAGVGIISSFIVFGVGSLEIISSRIYGFMNIYILISVPMFLLMASIMEKSGVAEDMYNALRVWAGRMPGGVAIVTLIASVFIASTTGIIGGEIILLGLVALPQMLRMGYQRKLAVGTICAGGSLGTMIPPSIVLIFYGLTANASIGDLFLASILPGLMLALIYIAYIAIRATLNPSLAPLPSESELEISLREKLILLKHVVVPIGIAGAVLGSIYMGVASVGEASAVGALATIVAAWLRKTLTWKMIIDSLKQVMSVSGMLLWIIFGANALIGVYNFLGGIAFMKSVFTGMPVDPQYVILIMMIVMFVLGCFMDWIGILLLTMPIFVPTIEHLGYDKIWFGVLFCMNMQISYLSPPFGPACIYLKSVAPKDVTMGEIYAGVLPFMALQALAIFFVVLFPEIALYLPSRF